MKPSKAATFAKAHRELKPRELYLPAEPGGPLRIGFDVTELGHMRIDNWTFTRRDALRIAAWITENFR